MKIDERLSPRARLLLCTTLEFLRKEIQPRFSDWKDADDWLFSQLDFTKNELAQIYEGRNVMYYDGSAVDFNVAQPQKESNTSKFQIFHSNERGRDEYEEAIKYWSNAAGDLHHHGKERIIEEQLPPILQRAYNELWSEDTGSYCYLVETPKGYGIALINEYDKWFSEDCGLSSDELFQSARKDASIIAQDSLFSKAEIYLGESMGIDRCHELAVIFPADIPKKDFDLAASKLETLVYQSAKTFRKSSLSDKIKAATNRAVNTKSHTKQKKQRTGALIAPVLVFVCVICINICILICTYISIGCFLKPLSLVYL